MVSRGVLAPPKSVPIPHIVIPLTILKQLISAISGGGLQFYTKCLVSQG